MVVAEMPEFPGGQNTLMKFLRENIKYPKVVQENGIQGWVYMSFVVRNDGAILNIEIARGRRP